MKKSTTPKPLTDRQRTFARHVAEGMPACHAYQAAGYKSTEGAARANSSKLLSNAMVTAEVARLRKDADTAADISRETVIQILTEVIRSKPSDATMDNQLCEIRMSKAGPFATFPDKMRSIERLCKMLGWDSPEKIEHSGTINLAAVLAEIAAEPMRLPCQQEA